MRGGRAPGRELARALNRAEWHRAARDEAQRLLDDALADAAAAGWAGPGRADRDGAEGLLIDALDRAERHRRLRDDALAEARGIWAELRGAGS